MRFFLLAHRAAVVPFLFLFLLLLQACGAQSLAPDDWDASAEKAAPRGDLGIQPQVAIYPPNPRYHTFDGVPRVLLGGASTVNPGESAAVDEVIANGGNYARLWHNFTTSPVAWRKLGSGKYDLNQWNEDYWTEIRDVGGYADSKRVILSVMLFSEPGLETGGDRWAIHPFNPNNNVNGLGLPAGDGVPEFYSLSNAKLRSIQESYVARLVQELSPSGNVIFEIVNEYTGPSDWEASFVAFVQARTSAPIAVNRLGNPAAALTLPNVDQANYHNLASGSVFGTFNSNYSKARVQHYDEQALGTQTATQLRLMAWGAILGGGGINWDQSGNPAETPGISLGVATFLSSFGFQPWNFVPTLLATPSPAMQKSTDEFVAYVAGASVSVNLTGWNGTYEVTWYDPVLRSSSPQPAVQGGSSRTFTAPGPPQVFHLKRAADGGNGTGAGSLSGRIVNDLNQNGVRDAGEPFIKAPSSCSQGVQVAGVTVNWRGSETGSATPELCDPQPYYSSGEIPAETYTVQLVLPSGWEATGPRLVEATVEADAETSVWFTIRDVD